jgi:hypothetical protein
MATARKKPPPKPASEPCDAAGRAPPAPAPPKVGETKGNLRARSEAFQRRRGKSG